MEASGVGTFLTRSSSFPLLLFFLFVVDTFVGLFVLFCITISNPDRALNDTLTFILKDRRASALAFVQFNKDTSLLNQAATGSMAWGKVGPQ